MTRIVFYKKNNQFVAVESNGHTGYDESGKDILCASISSIMQSAILGMMKVVGVKDYKYKINEDKGSLKFRLPDNIDKSLLDKCNILFETMYVSLLDLQQDYSNYLLMEVIEDVY